MSKLDIKTNSLWNSFNYGFSIVSLFFLFPFMIHHLGDVNYGFYIFLGTINGVASIANFGFGEATIRFVALYHNTNNLDKLKKILSTSFWTYLILGLIVSLCIIIFAGSIVRLLHDMKLDSHTAVYFIRISTITFFIRFIMGIYSSVPQALQRFDISSKIAIFETILRIGLYVTVLLSDYGLRGVVYSELIVAAFISIVNIVVSSKMLNTLIIFNRISKQAFREIFGYSIFSFLTQLVGLFWQYSDRILLGYFLGTAAIAYFSVPQQIIFKILGLVTSASAVLFPRFSMFQIDDSSKKIYKEFTLISLLFTIIVFSCLAFVIKDFIALWISTSFAKSTLNIAIFLSISCMIRGAFPIYENLFKGIGKPIYNLYIILLSSFIIVVMDLILIPIIGLNGAGIAYIVSPIAGVITLLLVWKKLLREDIKGPFKFYFIPLIISYILLLFSLLVKRWLHLSPSWIGIILQIIIFGILQVLLLVSYYKVFVPEIWRILIDLAKRIQPVKLFNK
jgi:O-antigen/teichoic acid export membrane protein